MIRVDDCDRKRPMTLPAACEWLGRQTGKVPATSTMWRWTLRGVRGVLRLESFRIGGTTYTTPEMIGRFIARTSPAVAAVTVTPDGIECSATADAGCRADERRLEIAAAQDRLKEICAPKRRGARATNTRR